MDMEEDQQTIRGITWKSVKAPRSRARGLSDSMSGRPRIRKSHTFHVRERPEAIEQ